jgi:hypothetical protein
MNRKSMLDRRAYSSTTCVYRLYHSAAEALANNPPCVWNTNGTQERDGEHANIVDAPCLFHFLPSQQGTRTFCPAPIQLGGTRTNSVSAKPE